MSRPLSVTETKEYDCSGRSLEMILTRSFCQTPTLEETVQRTKVDADISPVIIHSL